MGQTLLNTQINNTYPGLLKTSDNAILGATEKVVGDGLGNDSTLSLGTASASFTGTLDLSAATVTGDNNTTYDLTSAQNVNDVDLTLTGSDAVVDIVKLVAGTNITLTDSGTNQITIDAAGGGGAAGLESGSGADSMQSAASLTTVAANASANSSIAIGNGATASGGTNDGSIAIGKNTTAAGNRSICISNNNGEANAPGSIQLGSASTINAFAARHIAIGTGINTNSISSDAISIGTDAQADQIGSISIGRNSQTTGIQSVALGYGVVGAKDYTTSVNALETLTNSTPTAGGIIMHDAGGTERRLNVDASGNLQVDSNPLAFGQNFVAPYFTHTGQDSQDIVYTTVTIPGGTFQTGDVISLQALEYRDGLNNWVYSSLWISDTAQTVGQPPAASANNFSFGQYQSPNARTTVFYDKTLFITSAGTMIHPYAVPGQGTNISGDPSEFYNINWANDQHFFFQMWVDSTTGTVDVGGISVSKR